MTSQHDNGNQRTKQPFLIAYYSYTVFGRVVAFTWIRPPNVEVKVDFISHSYVLRLAYSDTAKHRQRGLESDTYAATTVYMQTKVIVWNAGAYGETHYNVSTFPVHCTSVNYNSTCQKDKHMKDKQRALSMHP